MLDRGKRPAQSHSLGIVITARYGHNGPGWSCSDNAVNDRDRGGVHVPPSLRNSSCKIAKIVVNSTNAEGTLSGAGFAEPLPPVLHGLRAAVLEDRHHLAPKDLAAGGVLRDGFA